MDVRLLPPHILADLTFYLRKADEHRKEAEALEAMARQMIIQGTGINPVLDHWTLDLDHGLLSREIPPEAPKKGGRSRGTHQS